MKKFNLTSIFLLGIFCSLFAQNPFLNKKKNSPNTGVNPTFKNFNYQVAKSLKSTRASKVKQANVSFSLPSGLLNIIGQDRASNTKIVYGNDGRPIFIKSEPSIKNSSKVSGTPNEIATKYLDKLKPILGLNKITDTFKLISLKEDKNGTKHLKYQQYYKEVKVMGQEVIVHLNQNNQVILFNGHSSVHDFAFDSKRLIDQNTALQKVENDLRIVINETERQKNSHILTENAFKPETVIYKAKSGSSHLAYQVEAFSSFKDRWMYFVDAKTGQILDKYYTTCTLHRHNLSSLGHEDLSYQPPAVGNGQDLNGVSRQVGTYEINGTHYMVDTSKPMFDGNTANLPDNGVGVLMVLDLDNTEPSQTNPIYRVQSPSSNWNNPTAISAQYNADTSFEYFRNTFNRNSINDQGGTIVSFINVADENGNSLGNAYWNGRAMFYGNGDNAFAPFAKSLDVGGHEMSHGVIQNTANLIYQDQSGAINESFADIFGAMIDRDDWLIGEDITSTQFFPTGALRDMQNPNNGGTSLSDPGWQPKDIGEIYIGTEDNGGVHINSGIVNRAYYLIATAIGKNKAEQVYYRTLTTYLTASSQFIDLRLGVVQSATDLYGANSTEENAAKTAFDTVGITDGNPTDTDEDLPPINGDQFILVAASEDGAANTLFITDETAQNFTPISSTPLFRKPTITDDGTAALFVTSNNTINAIALDPNDPRESEISGEQIWGAISISKDGNRLAVTLTEERNSIFILDLEGGTNREFTLYNPTTSQDGNTTGEVLYADALEWDYTGQYLIYDALNEFSNANGSSLEYWDVSTIRVWDNGTNDYGDGNIQKLFTNLPDGVSIGNPSLSKTSNNILAFDFFNTNTNEYFVLTADIEKNEVQTIWPNISLGFPNYANTDRKLIFDGEDDVGTKIIASVNLQADRITPEGVPEIIIENAKWGIWYTQGEREIEDIPATNFLIKSTGESCANRNNGSISVTTQNSLYDYNAIISGNGINETRRFNSQTVINNLQAGIYNICITVDGLQNQEFCYEVVIKEPEALAVSSRLDSSNKTVKLNLSGGKRYTIKLNELTFETEDSFIDIPLQDKITKLLVFTDKECQGIYEETLFLNDTVRVYPNPVKSGFVFIDSPLLADQSRVTIYNLNGTVVYEANFGKTVNQQLKIQVDELSTGIYMIQVKTPDHTSSHKIIKK